MYIPTSDELRRIRNWVDDGKGEMGDDTRYPGMTFEQGMEYMLDVLEGHMTVDELLEE